MDTLPGTDPVVTVQLSTSMEDLDWCARLMASNEPWITLQRSYDSSLLLLSDPINHIFLFTQGGERIGFILVKLKGGFTGYIQTIVFVETVRSRGIGREAIGYVEDFIFKTTSNVFICVSSFNTRAQNLYEKMGYEVIGILKDYIREGFDEVLLRKTRGPLNNFGHSFTDLH